MRIDWSTLALQTVNALILVWLLARFLFRPVADIITQRQASAHALMNEANTAKASAQVERDALSAEREQLATQRAQALAQAEADADKQRASLLAAAHEEADRLRAQAAADRARESAAQAEAASALAVQLAVDIARKLLDRVPDSLRITAFVDGLADGVRSLSPAARAEMASDASLQLTVPRALTPDERAACETALSAALGSTIALHAQVDRALIAGLELTGTHGVVRNSWRDQLEQIHTGLLRDDGHTR
jgi:F-type H+-transporting ATPase subunit b